MWLAGPLSQEHACGFVFAGRADECERRRSPLEPKIQSVRVACARSDTCNMCVRMCVCDLLVVPSAASPCLSVGFVWSPRNCVCVCVCVSLDCA